VGARIHFALNCAAASSPAIKLYSTDTLEEGLAAAAEAFCTSEVVIEPADKKATSAMRLRSCWQLTSKLAASRCG
jgi:hypothetical protein